MVTNANGSYTSFVRKHTETVCVYTYQRISVGVHTLTVNYVKPKEKGRGN